jgi:hypothetical protein
MALHSGLVHKRHTTLAKKSACVISTTKAVLLGEGTCLLAGVLLHLDQSQRVILCHWRTSR